jgi:ATP-dependent DNA ligase
MEAQLMSELPVGEQWQYEPKWDGFRGVFENDGGELALWSRNGKPLLRYFPELRAVGELLPPHSALDGEIVIAQDGRLEFDLMQMRLHPAESRIKRLSAELPAEFVAFDVLLWDGEPVHELPLAERRARLEALAGIRVSPAIRDVEAARTWLSRLESAGLDGVVAKRLDLPYLPGSREAVAKVKERRTADCVVVGARWKEQGGAGSTEPAESGGGGSAGAAAGERKLATLLLGLRRDDGGLDYVGSAAVGARRHAEVLELVAPLLEGAPDRGFSEPNRWGGGNLAESALRPELVAEVEFDKVQGNRFRHGAKLLRFRLDKDPEQCTWAEVNPPRRPDDPTFESLLAG